MKQKILLSTFVGVILAMGVQNMGAQLRNSQAIQNLLSSGHTIDSIESSCFVPVSQPTKVQAPVEAKAFPLKETTPQKASGNYIEVEVVPIIDAEVWNPKKCFNSLVMLINKDHQYAEVLTYDANTYEWDSEYVFTIEPGTYDAIIWMLSFNEIGYVGKQAYVIHEDVELDTNGYAFELDMSEATECVHFQSKQIDGSETKLPTWEWVNKLFYWDIASQEEGNAENMYILSLLAHVDYGVESYLGSTAYYIDADSGWNSADAFDFWVNPDVSDKYRFIQLRRWGKGQEYYITHTAAIGLEKKTITNEPSDLAAYADNFALTPNPQEDMVYHWATNVGYVVNGTNWSKITSSYKVENLTHYLYSQPNLAEELNVDVTFALRKDVLNVPVDYGSYVDYTNYGTWTIPMLLSTYQNPYYYNSLYSNSGFYTFLLNEEMTYKELDWHERYSFDAKQKNENIWGNSAPIAAVQTQVYLPTWAQKTLCQIMPDYVGRLGELREADKQLLSWTVSNDGVKLYDDTSSTLNTWIYDFNNTDATLGQVDVHMENHNVLVDDIQGYNICDIHMDWTNKEFNDRIAPTLQALMMRNSADAITDRFESATDGYLEFSGADFEFFYESGESTTYYFYEQPMSVKVEYAPNGSSEWEELTDTEIIYEYFQMPAFGYFYRTSLCSVNRKSDNGWFDLRISLTDDAGNSQVQQLSPAFFIKNLASGLREVNSGNINMILERWYDLQGRLVSNPNSGIYIRMQYFSDGTTRYEKITLR